MNLVLGGAAVAIFIAFLGALRATLRQQEGEAGALSATAVIAGYVVGAGVLVTWGSRTSVCEPSSPFRRRCCSPPRRSAS